MKLTFYNWNISVFFITCERREANRLQSLQG